MADVDVVTDALRTEAKVWDRNSEALGTIHGSVEGLRLNRLEAGMFQIFCSAYEDAVNQISDRCSEGRIRMSEIADALVRNATAYDKNEAETTQSVEGAY